MGFVVVVCQKLHRVRGHHRQLELRSELHRRHHMALVLGPVCALHFQVKALRKQAGKMQGAAGGSGRVTLQERLADRATLRA